MCWTYQESQAAKPEDEAGHDSGDGPDPTRSEPIEKNHPEGNESHNQSGHSGGEGPLGQANSTIAYEKEQKARDGSGTPLGRCRPNPGLPTQHWIKNDAGGEVAGCGKQQRRKRLNADSDGEIGGTPNHVDSGKRSDQQDSIPTSIIERPRHN